VSGSHSSPWIREGKYVNAAEDLLHPLAFSLIYTLPALMKYLNILFDRRLEDKEGY
jgi:hypothetical protein